MTADEVARALNKHFKSRVVARVADVREHIAIRTIPFGILGLDIATGGAPLGRIIQVAGYEGTCKTGLLLKMAGNAVRRTGKPVFIIDTEHSFEEGYCIACGLDPSSVYLAEPESLEIAGEIAVEAVEADAYSCVILDSFSAREARRQIDKSLSKDADENMLPAKIITKISRMLLRSVGSKSNFDSDPVGTIFASTNHQYEIPTAFAGPKVHGGHGQRHAGSILIRMTRSKTIKVGSKDRRQEVGREITWLVEKCKTAPDSRSGRVEFYTADCNGLNAPGFNIAGEIINYGVGMGVVKRSGNRYSFMASPSVNSRSDCNSRIARDPDEGRELVIGGNREEAEAYLIQDPMLVSDMYIEILRRSGWSSRIEWEAHSENGAPQTGE